MQIDISTFVWSVINILVMVIIIYFVYRVVRSVTGTVQRQRKNEETIIKKLDDIIEQNKKTIEELSKE